MSADLDIGAAVDLAREALGQVPIALPAGDGRTRALMAAHADTRTRLGWRWSFHASPEALSVSIET